ncbi:hypothetical protein MFLAVUS_006147 [Mucor flavus]|uniref:Uncharacterized protein n=1 Tax=Mucor flavus TaxID=439312 RepID=A0ABP9Z0R1_9FUNG
MLTKYCKGDIHSWEDYVDSALFSCRIRKHATTGYSPFFLVYGQDPVLPGDVRESSSEAAKSNQIISEDGTQYGRKLDVSILSEHNDHDEIEVCSNEFKKLDATSTMKCYQQSKNLRLNACIWKKLFDISGKKNLSVDYFDFIGRRGILTQLFFHKNNFVGHALCQFVIVKSLVELEILHESILNNKYVKKRQYDSLKVFTRRKMIVLLFEIR